MVNKPYGGKLVNRVLAKQERTKTLKAIADLPQISINKAAALDAEKIALGAFSPMEGFMGSEEYHSVLYKDTLLNGLPWSIPLILSPNSHESAIIEKLSEGDNIALNYKDKPIAILHLEEKYEYDKKKQAKQVFGTVDLAHPDIKKIEAAGNFLLAGTVDLIERVSPSEELSPQETRRVFEQRKWVTITAFQTRNPPHVAHEYIQRCALELVDGLFIHPVVGELKPDDFPPEAVVESYAYLTGNYYPEERVFLSPFSIAMRYAGPKASVFLAIIRKNYGCTHFIVGRDMAGVGNYYGSYAAHELFRKLDLGIEPMLFRESYYCNRCRSVATEKTCVHPSENHLRISMTRLRELLSNGTRPPPEIMRPEIADLLMKYQKPLAERTLKGAS
jgi:sulfate adenylyltransferase